MSDTVLHGDALAVLRTLEDNSVDAIVTDPPAGIVLDCFAGSGSTCVAAIQEGKHFIAIEQDESYVNIANARINHAHSLLAQEASTPRVERRTVATEDSRSSRLQGTFAELEEVAI